MHEILFLWSLTPHPPYSSSSFPASYSALFTSWFTSPHSSFCFIFCFSSFFFGLTDSLSLFPPSAFLLSLLPPHPPILPLPDFFFPSSLSPLFLSFSLSSDCSSFSTFLSSSSFSFPSSSSSVNLFLLLLFQSFLLLPFSPAPPSSILYSSYFQMAEG